MKKHYYGMAVRLEIKIYFSVALHSLKTQPMLVKRDITSLQVSHNFSPHASCHLDKFDCSVLFR